ncbi:MAG TPA: potassium-transporting ATPase subunit KdpC [Tepidisphaeraceae bacterium]|jgi:K+-transporting ATPase ATPase C chain
MMNVIRPAVVSFLLLSVLTGVIYPAVVTAVARAAFADKAAGSVVMRDGRAIGSELIAQPFTDAKYFWPRPSAANYDAAAGSGSNLGPNHPALAEAVKGRIAALRAADPDNAAPVPTDLVTASASGLDPHVSYAAAQYQAARVARARGVSEQAARELLDRHTQSPTFGLLGERRVNVLRLNLALDRP